MAKVYVSSTVADLKSEREAVINWLIQARHQPVHSYLPDSETAHDSCLADIDGCDLYVLILGHRYGHIPEANNPGGLCITQLEFRHAVESKMPCVALIRTNVPSIELSDLLDPDLSKKVLAFHAKVTSTMRASEFSNLVELIAALSTGIQNELSKLAAKPATLVPDNQRVPKPRLRLPQHAIIGRDKLVKKIHAGLQAGQRDFAFVYLPGVGKTTVAAALMDSKALIHHFPDGALWAHLGHDPDVYRQLSKWAKSLGLTREDIADCKNIAELGEAIAQAIGDGRMLLIIDDVWTTESGERFMIGGPDCTRIITTRYKNVARELMPDTDAIFEVPKLSLEEGFQLLADLSPLAARISPEALYQLVRRVDGLPIALVLIGKMLRREGDDKLATISVLKAMADIGQFFHEKKPLEFSENKNFSLGEVVEVSYRALGTAGPLNRNEELGNQLRLALEALSILRPDPAWFPISLAKIVSGAQDQTIKLLADAGLIETIQFAGDNGQNEEIIRYTMHRMIAEYIRAKLLPERRQALNRIAADYYLKRLEGLEQTYQEGDATTYSFMYRYEDQEWQDCQDNWLYYFSQTGYDAEVNISFLRVWFDGFWWWNCFTGEGYDFCDELLKDWDYQLSLTFAGDASSPSLDKNLIERLMDGLELLGRFKRAYPKETEDRREGNWAEVAATLNEIRHRANLDGCLDQLSHPYARHVRGLTDVFLAEAERFGKGNIAAAEAFYREALLLFREAKEDWNIAWLLYHLADMLSTVGGRDEARTQCIEALALGHTGSDYEVIALTHRVLGDCALADQCFNEALRNYQLAVEYAYRFQVEPEALDSYTIRFYSSLSKCVAGQLLNIYATHPDQAQHIACALRHAWMVCGVILTSIPDENTLLADSNVEQLAMQLFPQTLPLEKLKSDGAMYASSVRNYLKAVER